MSCADVDLEPGPALVGAWNRVLDDFEASLDRALVQAGADFSEPNFAATSMFTPPTTMPPFPDELAERARRLLARNTVAIDTVAAASDRLRPGAGSGAGPASRPHVAQRGSASPSFDTRA